MYKPQFHPGEMRVSPRHFQLPDKQGRRIAYTYIQKNGCSNFKVYLLNATGAENWRDKKISQQKLSQAKMEQGNWDRRIFVYRDPLKRFISTFLNKFVAEKENQTVFQSFESLTGNDPKQATFFDVLAYVEKEMDKTDSHFWPQKAHLACAEYNMVIPLERLTEEMTALFGTGDGPERAFARRHNATKYGQENDLGALVDVPVDQLIVLVEEGNLLSPANFETAETLARIRDIYKEDYQMIERLEA